MYISYDISLLSNPLQNAQQHQHTCTCKKNHVICRFHYPLPLMSETKKLKPLQINGNYPFSQQCLQTQVNKILQSLKDFLKMMIYHFLNIKFFKTLMKIHIY
jgi:hypothetical protein